MLTCRRSLGSDASRAYRHTRRVLAGNAEFGVICQLAVTLTCFRQQYARRLQAVNDTWNNFAVADSERYPGRIELMCAYPLNSSRRYGYATGAALGIASLGDASLRHRWGDTASDRSYSLQGALRGRRRALHVQEQGSQ